MGKALEYEYLIRAVFKCGRGVKHGADADTYRYMRSIQNLPRVDKPSEYELGVIIGRVSAYLLEALNKVVSIYEDDTEFTDKIENCFDYLREPTVEKIDKCIVEAWEAFKGIGLKVG